MKRFTSFLLFLLTLSSCMHDELDRVPVTVRLDGVDVCTKVTGESRESALVEGQVFLFDHSTGELDDYAVSEGNQAKLSATSGTKDVYAVVNAGEDLSGIRTVDELLGKVHRLAAESGSNLTMTGELLSTTIEEGASKVVTMRRMVARVSLLAISNSLPGGYDFTLDAVYLDNVSSSCTLGAPDTPLGWYDRMRYEQDNTCDVIADTGLDTVVDNGGSYSTEHYFYALPNPYPYETEGGEWSPRRTRLVIEGRINGTTVYYPYTLPELKRNKRYVISLVRLTSVGGDDPDMCFGSADFEISEREWTDGGDYYDII